MPSRVHDRCDYCSRKIMKTQQVCLAEDPDDPLGADLQDGGYSCCIGFAVVRTAEGPRRLDVIKAVTSPDGRHGVLCEDNMRYGIVDITHVSSPQLEMWGLGELGPMSEDTVEDIRSTIKVWAMDSNRAGEA